MLVHIRSNTLSITAWLVSAIQAVPAALDES